MRSVLPLAFLAASFVSACDSDAPADPDARDTDASPEEVRDTSPDPDTASPDADTTLVDTTPDTVTRVPVGPRACCLSMEGDLVIWSDDGVLMLWDSATNAFRPLVSGPSIAKDPVIAGRTVIFADNRLGDFDLWTLNLDETPPTPRLLRGGPGDQDQPVLQGTRLVWVGRDLAPHTPREAEIWTRDLAVPDSEKQLTSDAYEQTQPDVSGDKIVWADFAHSPDAMYIDVSDPLRNNADIFGWDLATSTPFTVTDDPSKQLRPAIDGDTVVWLDWRGINPEPKYSEFQVFVRRLAETGPNAERRLAWSSWSRPELWRRPALENDVVVFIAEPTTPGSGFVTGLLAVNVDGGAPWLVAGSTSVLDSVVVKDRHAAFVGASALGRVELRLR